MSSTSGDSDRDLPSPFLVQLFYRSGSFYRPDDFASSSLPAHISIYTWSSCTLSELAMELAATKPSALPYPAIGTRLVFQLVYPDIRSATSIHNSPPRYAVKDLGSIVIGQGAQEADMSGFGDTTIASRGEQETGRTLDEARFVVGDFISCAILPPLSDGSVAPATDAQTDLSSGARGFGGQIGGFASREDGFGRGTSRGGRGRRPESRMAGGYFPAGDWRRGEALPGTTGPRPRRNSRW
ncbi:hypothetical protein HIM_12067 [Hirsutella minnesotensis 3608]|uniref:Histone deacetylase complex subunit SAP18 n=1 Tax=Hirsutella minnesotensis 3608 TaxID=1043627 RepID=A0A0F8A0H1_9HYPO|nr:hypothetical protein HIM_12067 [Hirsutella minnesotensis 3608]